MSTISDPCLSGGTPQANGEHLHCLTCHSDKYLTIHSIEALTPPAHGRLTVTYTCDGCGDIRSQQAAAAQVTALLDHAGDRETTDVLQFGTEYIHCGEPMHAAGSELRSIYAPVTTEPATQGILDVYLSTRVLRCACGFQMEIPE